MTTEICFCTKKITRLKIAFQHCIANEYGYFFLQGELSVDNIFFAVKTTKKYHKDRGILHTYPNLIETPFLKVSPSAKLRRENFLNNNPS